MNIQTIRTVALCMAGLAASHAYAAELTLPRDGWASWEVAAVEGAPAWCCWSNWDNNASSRTSCQLDKGPVNLGNHNRHETTDTARVYARVAGGKVERMRVLAASCPVETDTPIQDLGNVAADDSARWLITLFKGSTELPTRHDLGENVLAAIAMHRSDVAQAALAGMARGNDHVETRKKAVFWLAVLRGVAGADVVTSVMFSDSEPELRKHAAFAITQSKSPSAASDLIRLGNADKDGDVRGQAWFWLAHTGAAKSEEAIAAALRMDEDEHVREQAVFALSQLPGERATRALIAVTEDRTLSQEQRKRAVFWLAQSEAEAAQKYLEKVLARNGGD